MSFEITLPYYDIHVNIVLLMKFMQFEIILSLHDIHVNSLAYGSHLICYYFILLRYSCK